MKLVFIYGLPATGKLTVARELESLTGYKLFHNHLVVDCLLSVFEFGSRTGGYAPGWDEPRRWRCILSCANDVAQEFRD